MKKIVFILAVFLITATPACNNAEKKNGEAKHDPKEQADSLEKEVIEGHDIAMPKSMKIPNLQKETKRLIDSIDKLPAKAQEAAGPYRAKLESLYKELGDAYASMEKWMDEFDYDSAKNNLEQRIKYLADEKLRVEKVKEAVLGSIEKADALLKEKF
jgi:hypothetical protein